MLDTQIQIAGQKDISALVILLNECASHLHQQGMSHWLGVYDHASVSENLQQKMVYVLTLKSQLIGCVALGMKPADYYEDCWPQAPSADLYLTQLAVHPRHQQAGYGELLVKHCLEIVSTDKTLQLDAVAHYPKLLNFYHKLGFKQIAEGIGLGDRRYLFEFDKN